MEPCIVCCWWTMILIFRRPTKHILKSSAIISALQITALTPLKSHPPPHWMPYLDVDMPGMDGVTVCRRVREVSSVPIIFLSAYAKTDDRIRGLLAGGDDYLGKPYSLTELELRIRLRIQRRHNVETRDVLRFGELQIDLGLREVRYQDDTAVFTSLEFNLLAFLAQNPGQVFSYEQLYDRVWKAPVNKGIHNMQVCMARVRQKLERLCPGSHYIETVRREGYRFLAEQRQKTDPDQTGSAQ